MYIYVLARLISSGAHSIGLKPLSCSPRGHIRQIV